ncbi:MAG: leucyl aminopeptidase [Flavobacteriales bacterium]|nr:leucyl aminopeptidase [Flavobacteriales bacterium]
MTQIKAAKNALLNLSSVTLFFDDEISKLTELDKQQISYFKKELEQQKDLIILQELNIWHYYVPVKKEAVNPELLEKLRTKGCQLQAALNGNKLSEVCVINLTTEPEFVLALSEGMALANYQFLKYLKDKKKKQYSLQTIHISDKGVSQKDADELSHVIQATCLARTLINEPVSYLSATQFGKEMSKAGKDYGFSVKVLGKKEIEAKKMGGLLAVNAGSIDPPTFTIMEYKPEKVRNKKPIVLVGKGVVFDTGGLSLKPTPGSMDEMKCDMSGGAAVVGALSAIAMNKLPVHVIGLVPATDNRPGMNAVCPQDIITISDGTTVEVLNTDAEGRLILADALVWAKQYKPELCIDLATLTGAAVRAIGSYASAIMGTAEQKVMNQLAESGMRTWERTVQFPMWKEYGDEMRSDIADLKNLGGANAGQITAGKFLEHFTDYPWIHIDIAGPAYLNAPNAYRTKGGTGVGVRLLYDFIKQNYC